MRSESRTNCYNAVQSASGIFEPTHSLFENIASSALVYCNSIYQCHRLFLFVHLYTSLLRFYFFLSNFLPDNLLPRLLNHHFFFNNFLFLQLKHLIPLCLHRLDARAVQRANYAPEGSPHSGMVCDPADLCQELSHIINRNNTGFPSKIKPCC